MRKPLALTLATTLATACTTTTYRVSSDGDMEVRLTEKRPGEQLIRQVKYEVRHNYYLLGFIPGDNPIDLASELGMKTGQALVNARIENSFEPIDGLITFGLGLLTVGIAPLIWTTRTTTVRGDLVALNKEGMLPPASSKEKDDEAAAPKTGPTGWLWLTGNFDQKGARDTCAKAGAKLPTRAQLKGYKGGDQEDDAGDVWTTDSQEDDGWSHSFDGGVTFLKDPGEELAVVCAKGSKAP